MNAQPTLNDPTDIDARRARALFLASRSIHAMGALFALYAGLLIAVCAPYLVRLAVHGVVHGFWVALPLLLLPIITALLLSAFGMFRRPAWGRRVAVTVCSLGVAYNVLLVAFIPLKADMLHPLFVLAVVVTFLALHLAGLVALLRGDALFGAHRLPHARLSALVSRRLSA